MKTTVLIDLSEIDTDDLKEEAEERGLRLYEDPLEVLPSIDLEDLRYELQSRGGDDLTDALRESLVIEWLRKSDPPQAVRDAFYNTYGRILL